MTRVAPVRFRVSPSRAAALRLQVASRRERMVLPKEALKYPDRNVETPAREGYVSGVDAQLLKIPDVLRVFDRSVHGFSQRRVSSPRVDCG